MNVCALRIFGLFYSSLVALVASLCVLCVCVFLRRCGESRRVAVNVYVSYSRVYRLWMCRIHTNITLGWLVAMLLSSSLSTSRAIVVVVVVAAFARCFAVSPALCSLSAWGDRTGGRCWWYNVFVSPSPLDVNGLSRGKDVATSVGCFSLSSAFLDC